MAERLGLDPDLASGVVEELARRLRAVEIVSEALSPVPAFARFETRRLAAALIAGAALLHELRGRIERQRWVSAAAQSSYGLGTVSLAGAGAIYLEALRDPAVLAGLHADRAAALFRRLSPDRAAELAAAWPEVVGRLEGVPYVVRDAANRASLRRVLGDASIGVDDPRRLAAEQVGQALRDAEARGLGPTQLVLLELPAGGGTGELRAAISVGDLDAAQDVGVMVPGMGSSVAGSIRGLVWNAGNLQTDLGRRSISELRPGTAVVAWVGYEAPTASPLDGDRFVASDRLARDGAAELNGFLAGLGAANADARTTVLAHSYGTRVATYALSSGGRADALVMYGSPGVAEGVDSVAALDGVPSEGVYSTKSAGDLVWSVGNVIDDAIRAGLTGRQGGLGVDVLGEELSNLDGRTNADPNDASFGAKVFETHDAYGHGLGEEGGSYTGYWGAPGTDSLDNGARIVLGMEPVWR